MVTLEPGQAYQTRLSITIHVTIDEVAKVEHEIETIQGELQPSVHSQPTLEFSPTE